MGRAERDSPYSPGSIIDLTESPSTTGTPPSHAITEDGLDLVDEELKKAIAIVSE
ncbi:hypothetical protein IFR05_013688 [Cadophora sp. M221]|nr:hypothetical protein IFR05_013688 [Cadophora sp. M221]